ncbi:MAG: hypothetical protein KatS3mg005_2058 [Bryobacteraceae bacterium]|nr:MAG: hypothetical protein KatS3mg005_2058 [Bryobacteraceae bacterium]
MLILPSTLHRLPFQIQAAGSFFVDLGSTVIPAADAEQAALLALDRGGHVGFTLPAGFALLIFGRHNFILRNELMSSWCTWTCASPANDVIFLFRYDGMPFRPIHTRLSYPCTLLHCAWGDSEPRLHPIVIGSVMQSLPVAPLPGVLRRLVKDSLKQAA